MIEPDLLSYLTKSHRYHASPRATVWVILMTSALWEGGCATYRPEPLDSAAVNAALNAPAPDAVRVAAAAFKHTLLAPAVIDGRDGFTPDEIAVMTIITSPRLRALRDQRGVVQAQVIQAGILPNPQLGYTLDQQHGNSDPTLVNGQSLGLSWEVTSLLARHDHVLAARATAGALDLSIAWQEWQSAQDARLRAFRLLSLEQRLPLAREIEDDLAENVKLIQRALALGQKTTSDLTLATSAWTQAQLDRLTFEQQRNADRTALNLALGQPADTPLRLKSGAADFAAAASPPASLLLDGLEQRRLDLVALRLGYESEEATLRAAVKAQFPKIGLSFAKANDTSDVRTRSFGVTLDLPLFDRNQGQIAIGRATRRQLFDEYVARVAEARAEVSQALADLAGTRVQVQAVSESLPTLEQLVAAQKKAFQGGNVDVLTYREARGALATRRIELNRLQQSLVELEIALEIATGRTRLAHESRP